MHVFTNYISNYIIITDEVDIPLCRNKLNVIDKESIMENTLSWTCEDEQTMFLAKNNVPGYKLYSWLQTMSLATNYVPDYTLYSWLLTSKYSLAAPFQLARML